MKLGSRIILGFSAICLIFVILSIFIFFFHLRPVRSGAQAIEKDIIPNLSAVNSMQYSVALEALFTMDFNYSFNDKSWARAKDFQSKVGDLLTTIKAGAQTDAGIKLINHHPQIPGQIADLEKKYGAFAAINAQLPPLIQKIQQSRTATTAAYTSLIESAEKFTRFQEELQLNEFNSETSLDVAKSRNARIAALSKLETLAGDLMIFNLRGLLQHELPQFDLALGNAQKISQILKELESGPDHQDSIKFINELRGFNQNMEQAVTDLKVNMAENIEITRQQAEIRDAALTSVNALADTLNSLAVTVATTSGQAVQQVIWVMGIGLLTSILGSLILAALITRGITKPVQTLINVLAEGANEVDHAATQLSSATDVLANGATENAASLEETSAALEELSSMTTRNAENAASASDIMGKTNEAVHAANISMADVIKAMNEISSAGNEIGKIIKTIDEIAFQTNLLALNAAVEAARAGEAGAGFAVVADEVRNLAIRSAEAAHNTADLIAATITNINSGAHMVETTASTFRNVEDHAVKVTTLLSEVAEASKEQSTGIGQINKAVTNMDKVTQSNAASAEESSSAANGLATQANSLLDAVQSLNKLIYGVSNMSTSPSHTHTERKPKYIAAPQEVIPRSTPRLASPEDDFDF